MISDSPNEVPNDFMPARLLPRPLGTPMRCTATVRLATSPTGSFAANISLGQPIEQHKIQ